MLYFVMVRGRGWGFGESGLMGGENFRVWFVDET
jgi:hypothetical protein